MNWKQHYFKPLKEKSTKGKLITETQLKALFSDIEIIQNYNTKMLKSLEPKIELDWSPSTCLGEIFLQFVIWILVFFFDPIFAIQLDKFYEGVYKLCSALWWGSSFNIEGTEQTEKICGILQGNIQSTDYSLVWCNFQIESKKRLWSKYWWSGNGKKKEELKFFL